MNITNPATAQTITTLVEDNANSIELKYTQAKAAQKDWAALTLNDRIEILKKFSNLLTKHIEENASILTAEVGKPLQQARNEINGAADRITWLTQNAENYLGDELMAVSESMTEKIVYEPLGVICNISAWNYPYLVGVNVFVPALLAGNAVLYKPSEFATLTGLQIEKYLKQAGVPDHVFGVIIGQASVGQMLLAVDFDGYYFTGSYQTGKYIYEKVAHKMVPCQLELGGKDPLYITDDVQDIAKIAAGTADGAFYNNGQSCCAVERIYVHTNVYQAYLEAFVKEVNSYKIGPPSQDGVYIGPLTRAAQLAILSDQVSDALEKGATLHTGGKPIVGQGYYFEPTVLSHVNHQMKVMHNESFGPIIGIMEVENDKQAIELMQDTAYGLTASVYSQSQDRAEQILAQINTGTGYWNCCDRVSAALPWSGRKHSGFGATLSHQGIRAFAKTKAYHLRK